MDKPFKHGYLLSRLEKSLENYRKVTGNRHPMFYFSMSGKLRTIDQTVNNYAQLIKYLRESLTSVGMGMKVVGCTDFSTGKNENVRLLKKDSYEYETTDQQRCEMLRQRIPFDYFRIQDYNNIPGDSRENRDIIQHLKFLESLPDFNFTVAYKTRFDLLLDSELDPCGLAYIIMNINQQIKAQTKLKERFDNFVSFRTMELFRLDNATKFDIQNALSVEFSDHDLFACANSCRTLKKSLRTVLEQEKSPNVIWFMGLTHNARSKITQSLTVGGDPGKIIFPQPQNKS